MLTLNDFAEGFKDVCSESILFSANPKPDVDFVTDLVKQQTNEVPENFYCVYDWISKLANDEDFFTNLFVDMSKEKISKIELLARGQSNDKLWYNYRKGVITASKVHSLLIKMNKSWKSTGNCVDMWSVCQNIPRLSFNNPDLPALKCGQTMEIEAPNEFFELMKKNIKI